MRPTDSLTVEEKQMVLDAQEAARNKMREQRLKQESMAETLLVDRGDLSRFLGGRHKRFGKLRLLEFAKLILDKCMKAGFSSFPPVPRGETMEEILYFVHSGWSDAIRDSNRFEPTEVWETWKFTAHMALTAPVSQRGRLICNTLAAAHALLSSRAQPPGYCCADVARPDLEAVRTVILGLIEEGRRLIEVETDETCQKRDHVRHKTPGYGGYALALLNLLLGDDRGVVQGFGLQVTAVLQPHNTSAGHWENVLVFCENLIADNEQGAGSSRSVIGEVLEMFSAAVKTADDASRAALHDAFKKAKVPAMQKLTDDLIRGTHRPPKRRSVSTALQYALGVLVLVSYMGVMARIMDTKFGAASVVKDERTFRDDQR